jgi:hypothetical protein
MKKIIFLFFTVLLFGNQNIYAEEPVLTITSIKTEAPIYSSKSIVSVYGINFESNASKLTVYLNGESYEVIQAFDQQIRFNLNKNSQSGLLYVEKTIDNDSKEDTIIQSNSLLLNLNNPIIEKINIKNGLQSGNNIILEGQNLGAAQFTCGNIKLPPSLQGEVKTIITIPNATIDCNIHATYQGFENKAQYKIKSQPSIASYSLSFQKEFVILEGKGFRAYQKNLSSLSLHFNKDIILNTVKYISDTKLQFTKNKAIPLEGNVQLYMKTNAFPSISYKLNNNIPRITNLKEIELTKDFKYVAHIETNTPINTLISNGGIIKMNNALVKGEINGSTISFILPSEPPKNGEIWIEQDGFQSAKYQYTYDHIFDFKPKITQVQVLSPISDSGGKIRISGSNFFSQSDFKVSANGKTLDTSKRTSHSVQTRLPRNTSKSISVSVSQSFGSSQPISIPNPSTTGSIIYPKPVIKEIYYPKGPFVGNEIQIQGSGLAFVNSINFEEKTFKVQWANFNTLSAIIPKTIPLQGDLSVNIPKTTSNAIKYEVYQHPKNTSLQIHFPAKQDTYITHAHITEFQNIFSFAVENHKEEITLNTEWRISCLRKNKCDNFFPFTEYQLINSEGDKIDDVTFTIDSASNKFLIKNIPVAITKENSTFSVQAKSFRFKNKNEMRIIKLFASNAKNKDLKMFNVEKSIKTSRISIRKNRTTTQSICQALNTETKEWKKCKRRRK